MSESDEKASVFGELIVCAIILYFAWKAQPAVAYFNRPLFLQALAEKETFIYYLVSLSDYALLGITIALPLACFMVTDEETPGFVSFVTLCVGPLGWWVGRQFNSALVEKARCDAQSFWGCSLDLPIFSFLAFSAVVIIAAVSWALLLLASLGDD